MERTTFNQGVKACVPTLLGYAGVGLSFGIIAKASGFSYLEIALLCLVVYAGAAQFIICTLAVAGAPISAIVFTAMIVNARMFLLSMTLAPHYKNETLLHRLGLGAILTDETFGVAITPYLRGEKISTMWLHGLNITAYLFWAAICLVGAAIGGYVQHPEMLGLDFAITAMFIFLGISQFETLKSSKIKLYICLILCVVVLMLVLSLWMPSYLAIIFAATITAALGVVFDR